MLLKSKTSQLFIIDVQERLAPAVADRGAVVQKVELLARLAQTLKIPALASEQNPDGLGITLAVLCEYLPSERRLSKMSFSAFAEPQFKEAVGESGRKQVVICGMETHVCVLQAAADLLDAGYQVFVVADACGSRTAENKQMGLERLRDLGAQIVTSEMVAFEWLGRSDHPAFKEMLSLIK